MSTTAVISWVPIHVWWHMKKEIIGATAATFDPKQETECETQKKRLTRYHILKRNLEKKSIHQVYYHSGYGYDVEIDIVSTPRTSWLNTSHL